MPNTDLLKQFGLARNPFTDRTAEKTAHDAESLYVHSDLRGFTPSETTYVFFGRRGSGKTTIRLQMQRAYEEANESAIAAGGRGHFMVDLCRPGHLTACLRNFQEAVGCSDDNWDAQFGESWGSADMVDCMLAYAATLLVDEMTSAASASGRAMLERVRMDPRASRQLLLLSHLYAKTDAASLAMLRRQLLPPRYSAAGAGTAAAVAGAATIGVVAAARDERVSAALASPATTCWQQLDAAAPALTQHPRLVGALALTATLGGAVYYRRNAARRSLERAVALTRNIRIQKQQPPPVIAALLDRLFTSQDRVDTIRGMFIGISAHQKLDLLASLVRLLGYESLAVFGDCFDEVVLLDPVQYPGAIKVFAREVCRNDLLNFGRLHFFFPDSRLALDLNTDKTLKEARFDRHFVRDLSWSRHQLEELAQRRFEASQQRLTSAAGSGGSANSEAVAFTDLFKAVKVEDFSSYLAKLNTPRELMLMMSEMFARIEAHPEGGLSGQDMEIAVARALEQSV